MDRTVAPPIAPITSITLPKVEYAQLSSGINVYYTIDRSIDAFKIDALTKAGFLQSPNAAISVLTSKLLIEGTFTYPNGKLMESIDGLGSFLEASPSFDYGSITLFGLSRFFEKNLSIFSSVLYEATLLEKDIEKLKSREKERLKLNQEKGSYLSSINLRKTLFPSNPYGYHLTNKDISNTTSESITGFYTNKVQSFDLFLAGNLPQDFLVILDSLFQKHHTIEELQFDNQKIHKGEDVIVRDSKFIQSSIRLGKVLFNRNHEDYLDFLVLNELLGGYFGSRLMKNIREDKGYTYGISSHLHALKNSGYFTIGTDVNNAAEEDTLVQIKKEIEILQNEIIPDDELKTVKNYLLGSFTNSLSAPFAGIDKFKVLNSQGYDLDFYNEYVLKITSVEAQRIRELAQLHLNWDSLTSSIVG